VRAVEIEVIIISAMDADRDSELDTIVERLLAVQELGAETRRLESKDRDISATDVTIPSSWLPLLSEGLEVAIEVAEEYPTDGDLRYKGAERVKRVRRLARAIGDVDPGNAYSVSVFDHEDELFQGLHGALLLQESRAARVSNDNAPLRPRFIESEQLHALSGFMSALMDLVEELSENTATYT
jgi:hypothetical protein